MRLMLAFAGWRAWVMIPPSIIGFVGGLQHGIGVGIGIAFAYAIFIAFIILVSDGQRRDISASAENRVKRGLPPVQAWRWRIVALTIVFSVVSQQYIAWHAAILLSILPISYGGILAFGWKEGASWNHPAHIRIVGVLIMWALMTLAIVLSYSGSSGDEGAYPCYGVRYTDC